MKIIYAALVAASLLLAGCGGGAPKIEDPQASTAGPVQQGQEPQSPQQKDPQADGPAKFGQTYAYEDGLKVSITKIVRRGSGVVFTIKITNGTKDTLEASDASVQASYGKDGNQAECCVSGDMSVDDYFSGKILPGRSKAATFSFKIPREGLSDVVVEVSPNYDEDPAIFQGAVK